VTDIVPPAPTPSETGTVKGDVTNVEPTRAQRGVARRTAEAKATIPEHTLSAEVDLEAWATTGSRDAGPDLEDLIIKACALALREVPRANASYRDAGFELYSRANVGFVVATQDALVVPTVFDADRRTVAEIAAERRALTERAQAGRLSPSDVSGATFTVANRGGRGAAAATAGIQGGQAAILAFGAAIPRAVVRDGAVVARTTATVTLTADHRILYGDDAERFLARVSELLAQPARLEA
jgi:pyruvate dehydrogenase E2 component (dihydrolipoamide acetyltransferase)